MELNHLPIIDWEQGTKLAGNKTELAKEILAMMIKRLAKDVQIINQFNKNENYKDMLKEVHKLHGALCYCGLPRLKRIVSHLETDLKNQLISNLPPLLTLLNTEVSLLLEHYPAPL